MSTNPDNSTTLDSLMRLRQQQRRNLADRNYRPTSASESYALERLAENEQRPICCRLPWTYNRKNCRD